MRQETLTNMEYSSRKKKTKREEFLEIMDEIIPLVVQIVQLAVDKLIDDQGWRFSLYNKAVAYVKGVVSQKS